MDLEPRTLDQVGDRCEECGAKLTPAEQQVALESGGPALCAIHTAEVVPVDEEVAEEE
jgi:methionyl-tRNA synthetase